MSKVVKGIKRVFKKVLSNKVFKVVAIAAAVLFTGGLAAGAFGGAATAASVATGLSSIPVIGSAAAGLVTAGSAVGAGLAGLVTSALGGGAAAGGEAAAAAAGMEGVGAGLTGSLASAEAASAGAGALGAAESLTAAGGGFVESATGLMVPASEAAGAIAPSATRAATTNGIVGWAKASPQLAMIAGQAASGMASAGVNAYGQAKSAEANKEEADRKREDEIRKGKVTDYSGTFYRKPGAAAGIINSVKGG